MRNYTAIQRTDWCSNKREGQLCYNSTLSSRFYWIRVIHISPAGHQDQGHTLDPTGRADETKTTGEGRVGGSPLNPDMECAFIH